MYNWGYSIVSWHYGSFSSSHQYLLEMKHPGMLLQKSLCMLLWSMLHTKQLQMEWDTDFTPAPQHQNKGLIRLDTAPVLWRDKTWLRGMPRYSKIIHLCIKLPIYFSSVTHLPFCFKTVWRFCFFFFFNIYTGKERNETGRWHPRKIHNFLKYTRGIPEEASFTKSFRLGS